MAAQTKENYQLYKRYVKNIALVYNSRTDIRAYVELMLSISVIVIFGIFAIRPTFVTIAELQKEIEERQEIVNKLDTKINNLDTAQKLINENRRALSLLDTAVPDNPLPVMYARQIEGLSKKNNTQLYGLGSDRVIIKGNSSKKTELNSTAQVVDHFPSLADSLSFRLNIQGDYLNLKEFIAELEKLRRPIFMDNVKLTQDVNNQGGFVTLSVTGRVPFLNFEK